MFSARYAGADPLRQRCVRTQRRNVIRSGTRSQWSSRRSGMSALRTPDGEYKSSSGVENGLQPVQQLSGDAGQHWAAVIVSSLHEYFCAFSTYTDFCF